MALSRPLDKLYIVYFWMMLPIAFLVDFQVFYPSWIVPDILKKVNDFYWVLTADPLVFGTYGDKVHLAWFHSFQFIELFFQAPVFFVALYGLHKGYRAVYIPIMLYGASTFTTILPCIITFCTTTADGDKLKMGNATITHSQRLALLANYAPFFFFTLLMVVDCAFQTLTLVQVGEKALKSKTTKAR